MNLAFFSATVSLLAAGALSCLAESPRASPAAPRPLRDRFRLIQSDVGAEAVADEIADFSSYGCERMVVVRNEAEDALRLWCASHNEAQKATRLAPGRAYLFTFRPRRSGESVFWCTVEYRQAWAKFDVHDERSPRASCLQSAEGVRQFHVRHDGVYAEGGLKIRSLLRGHNGFTLWEQFEGGRTDGMLMRGRADGGECADLPQHGNDRAAAVSLCEGHCLHLFEHFGCLGETQTVGAPAEDCQDFAVEERLRGKLSAVQGC